MLISLLTTIPDTLLSALPDAGDAARQISKALSLILSMLGSEEGSANEVLTTAIRQFHETHAYILAGITLVFALAGCFFGFKLARLFMTISGFFSGLILGAMVGVKILKASNGIVILCALAGALLLAVFAYKIYQGGIFLLCFFLAFGAAANVIPLAGNLQFFLCTVIGFVVGTLALKYVRPVIILSSAMACGYTASRSLVTLGPLTGLSFFGRSYTLPVLFVGLFLLGSALQFLTTDDEDAKKRDRKR